jgi:hypothetical protein
LSDPDSLQSLARSFKTLLGASRVEHALRAVQRDPFHPPHLDVLRGFALLQEWTAALAESREPPDAALMLKFGMVAMTVRDVSQYAGAGAWLRELSRHAFHSDPELFYEKLFEGEVAKYWTDRIAGAGPSARFGRPSGHPDLWLTLPPPRGISFPTECKRIRRRGDKEIRAEVWASELEIAIQTLVGRHFPMKVITWLHEQASAISTSEIVALIDEMASAGSATGKWTTRVCRQGTFQVSMAPLGRYGEFQPPPLSIVDVPATGILKTRSQLKKTNDGDRVRMKSILSVRSDLARDRIGSVQASVRKATRQLQRADPSALVGIIAIRIRPPQDLGDLLETDQVIRSELVRIRANHVCLVIVCWDESEGDVRDLDSSEQRGVERTIRYNFRPYFIQNRVSGVSLGLDSYDGFFGDLESPVVRDPSDGSIKPVDPQTWAVLQGGGDLPEAVVKGQQQLPDLDESKDAATMFLKFGRSLANLNSDQAVTFLQAGSRHFRCFIDRTHHLRTFEIENASPRRVATIDLRAWADKDELCFSVEWDPSGFRVGIWNPEETQQLWVRACRVPQVRISSPLGTTTA